jgi:hypothetical protein
VDLSIKSVYHNQISYLGNKFPVDVEVQNTGFLGQNAKVGIYEAGKLLDEQDLAFSRDGQVQTLHFLLKAEQKGVRHFVVKVQELQREFTFENNNRHLYVEVVDGKEKILIAALAPHPDIKALKAAFSANENYETDVVVPALGHRWDKGIKYDLVVFHQIPDRDGKLNEMYKHYVGKTPCLFVLGKQTNFQQFNQENGVLQITQRGAQQDWVLPIFNHGFRVFNVDDEDKGLLGKYPPVSVPFGQYKLAAASETILFQKVGKVATDLPLVAVSAKQSAVKNAVVAGEGIWAWRLSEYAESGSQKAFDALFQKIVQYLSAKEDKGKFRVTPGANDFLDSDEVFFETEAYNDIYEKIFGQKVEMNVVDEAGNARKYSYVNAHAGFKFKISALPEGLYRYTAQTLLDGKLHTAGGQFTVKSLRLEAIDTRADFNAMRLLAGATGGMFAPDGQEERLAQAILAKDHPKIMHSTESYDELMRLEWVLYVLLLLAVFEWFMRKYKGGF